MLTYRPAGAKNDSPWDTFVPQVEFRTLAWYVTQILNKQRFTFTRWGDGEWAQLWMGTELETYATRLLKAEMNCDMAKYLPEVGDRLRQSIALNIGKTNICGLQTYAVQKLKDGLHAYFSTPSPHVDSTTWVVSDIFYDANTTGSLYPLIAALRTRDVMFVGPEHVCSVASAVMDRETPYVCIPSRSAHDAAPLPHVSEVLNNKLKSDNPVILFSAGWMANIWINEWAAALPTTTMIDCGSLWDVYAGVKSRSVYRRGKWKQRIRMNLGKI